MISSDISLSRLSLKLSAMLILLLLPHIAFTLTHPQNSFSTADTLEIEVHHEFTNGENYTCTYHSSAGEGEMMCYGNHDETEKFVQEEEHDEVFSTPWWIHLGISVGLTLVAGLMSGLTMGLMSLDLMTLRILKESGSPSQRKYSAAIIPLVEHHHLLLVTLLLCNAAAMEALPIFLERLLPPALAIIVSVTAVLLFGEIIPQSICTRYGLAIGYYLSWLVWGLIVVTFILSYPIAKLLDVILGTEHGNYFRHAELKELVQQHQGKQRKKRGKQDNLGTISEALISGDVTSPLLEEHDENEESGQGPLDEDEVAVIRGALSMREKRLTPDQVYSLEVGSILTKEVLIQIASTRIPIYRRRKGHVLGLILAKKLIGISDSTPVKSMKLVQLPRVNADTPLYDLLNLFKIGRSHMALVLDPNDNVTVLGIVTLEDVLEQLLEIEIRDELDEERTSVNETIQNKTIELALSGAPIPAAAPHARTSGQSRSQANEVFGVLVEHDDDV